MDWRFARAPKWVASHLFAGLLIVGFVAAGVWQLQRLDDRRESNARIEERALVDPVSLASALERPVDERDFVAVRVSGRFVDGEIVRVANRSQDGRGGDWVVGGFETIDGRLLFVNRGFVLRDEITASTPTGDVELTGWLRASRTKGWIGADDSGVGPRVPRLNVDDVAARIGRTDVVDHWFQLDTIDGTDPSAGQTVESTAEMATPRPIALDDLDEGNHLSYALQWFSFAALSIVVYGLLLRKIASPTAAREMAPR